MRGRNRACRSGRGHQKRGTGEVDSFITIEFKQAELNRGFSGSIFKLEPKPGYEVYEERLEPAAPPK